MNNDSVILLAEILKTKAYIISLADALLNEEQLESFYKNHNDHLQICLDDLARKHPYVYDSVKNEV